MDTIPFFGAVLCQRLLEIPTTVLVEIPTTVLVEITTTVLVEIPTTVLVEIPTTVLLVVVVFIFNEKSKFLTEYTIITEQCSLKAARKTKSSSWLSVIS